MVTQVLQSPSTLQGLQPPPSSRRHIRKHNGRSGLRAIISSPRNSSGDGVGSVPLKKPQPQSLWTLFLKQFANNAENNRSKTTKNRSSSTSKTGQLTPVVISAKGIMSGELIDSKDGVLTELPKDSKGTKGTFTPKPNSSAFYFGGRNLSLGLRAVHSNRERGANDASPLASSEISETRRSYLPDYLPSYSNGSHSNGFAQGRPSTTRLSSNGHTSDSSLTTSSSISKHSQIGNGLTTSSSPAHSPPHPLVALTLRPDGEGKFGFNVQGGRDQNLPVVVSRVTSLQTTCGLDSNGKPRRLNEGDTIKAINNKITADLTHAKVVSLIKHCGLSGQPLTLVIASPSSSTNASSTPLKTSTTSSISRQIVSKELSHSLALVKQGLSSGEMLTGFNGLAKSDSKQTSYDSISSENVHLNRYRDILCYDRTRVLLDNPEGILGDYVNASHVNMEIPGPGVVNRYICAQGPLPHTCIHFWRMVYEQRCGVILMLTTKVENGIVKCHQYWPDLYATTLFGDLQVSCVAEKNDQPMLTRREFTLTCMETKEKRQIIQLQYNSWPDHGVPSSCNEFLAFLKEAGSLRVGELGPTLVHCSAGIGRTGVFVLLETSASLMESGQPIAPLDLVRHMRTQRANLIQTGAQFKFALEAILSLSKDLKIPIAFSRD